MLRLSRLGVVRSSKGRAAAERLDGAISVDMEESFLVGVKSAQYGRAT
jgi:hypothetical protein